MATPTETTAASTSANSVYNSNNLTATATPVPSAGSDNRIPIQGSAAPNWKAITSDSFLAGPEAGQEQTLVKIGNQTAKVATGERKHDVSKNAITHVNTGDNLLFYHQNRNTDVTLNDKLTVHGDREIGITGKQTVTVTGEQQVTVIKDHKLNVIENLKEHANRTVTIDAGVELVLQGPGGMIKIDKTGVTIQGVLVKIN
ncbi:MAG TPA: hypothetical protein VJ302_20230 [Blastocatellia bacterium]|nr:hypothetical protein [Blastocatellia bacterium]